ncbi:hypothetical protein WDU94_015242 [Cyamophila willieti]
MTTIFLTWMKTDKISSLSPSHYTLAEWLICNIQAKPVSQLSHQMEFSTYEFKILSFLVFLLFTFQIVKHTIRKSRISRMVLNHSCVLRHVLENTQKPCDTHKVTEKHSQYSSACASETQRTRNHQHGTSTQTMKKKRKKPIFKPRHDPLVSETKLKSTKPGQDLDNQSKPKCSMENRHDPVAETKLKALSDEGQTEAGQPMEKYRMLMKCADTGGTRTKDKNIQDRARECSIDSKESQSVGPARKACRRLPCRSRNETRSVKNVKCFTFKPDDSKTGGKSADTDTAENETSALPAAAEMGEYELKMKTNKYNLLHATSKHNAINSCSFKKRAGAIVKTLKGSKKIKLSRSKKNGKTNNQKINGLLRAVTPTISRTGSSKIQTPDYRKLQLERRKKYSLIKKRILRTPTNKQPHKVLHTPSVVEEPVLHQVALTNEQSSSSNSSMGETVIVMSTDNLLNNLQDKLGKVTEKVREKEKLLAYLEHSSFNEVNNNSSFHMIERDQGKENDISTFNNTPELQNNCGDSPNEDSTDPCNEDSTDPCNEDSTDPCKEDAIVDFLEQSSSLRCNQTESSPNLNEPYPNTCLSSCQPNDCNATAKIYHTKKMLNSKTVDNAINGNYHTPTIVKIVPETIEVEDKTTVAQENLAADMKPVDECIASTDIRLLNRQPARQCLKTTLAFEEGFRNVKIMFTRHGELEPNDVAHGTRNDQLNNLDTIQENDTTLQSNLNRTHGDCETSNSENHVRNNILTQDIDDVNITRLDDIRHMERETEAEHSVIQSTANSLTVLYEAGPGQTDSNSMVSTGSLIRFDDRQQVDLLFPRWLIELLNMTEGPSGAGDVSEIDSSAGGEGRGSIPMLTRSPYDVMGDEEAGGDVSAFTVHSARHLTLNRHNGEDIVDTGSQVYATSETQDRRPSQVSTTNEVNTPSQALDGRLRNFTMTRDIRVHDFFDVNTTSEINTGYLALDSRPRNLTQSPATYNQEEHLEDTTEVTSLSETNAGLQAIDSRQRNLTPPAPATYNQEEHLVNTTKVTRNAGDQALDKIPLNLTLTPATHNQEHLKDTTKVTTLNEINAGDQALGTIPRNLTITPATHNQEHLKDTTKVTTLNEIKAGDQALDKIPLNLTLTPATHNQEHLEDKTNVPTLNKINAGDQALDTIPRNLTITPGTNNQEHLKDTTKVTTLNEINAGDQALDKIPLNLTLTPAMDNKEHLEDTTKVSTMDKINTASQDQDSTPGDLSLIRDTLHEEDLVHPNELNTMTSLVHIAIQSLESRLRDLTVSRKVENKDNIVNTNEANFTTQAQLAEIGIEETKHEHEVIPCLMKETNDDHVNKKEETTEENPDINQITQFINASDKVSIPQDSVVSRLSVNNLSVDREVFNQNVPEEDRNINCSCTNPSGIVNEVSFENVVGTMNKEKMVRETKNSNEIQNTAIKKSSATNVAQNDKPINSATDERDDKTIPEMVRKDKIEQKSVSEQKMEETKVNVDVENDIQADYGTHMYVMNVTQEPDMEVNNILNCSRSNLVVGDLGDQTKMIGKTFLVGNNLIENIQISGSKNRSGTVIDGNMVETCHKILASKLERSLHETGSKTENRARMNSTLTESRDRLETSTRKRTKQKKKTIEVEKRGSKSFEHPLLKKRVTLRKINTQSSDNEENGTNSLKVQSKTIQRSDISDKPKKVCHIMRNYVQIIVKDATRDL